MNTPHLIHHIQTLLALTVEHTPDRRALIVADTQSDMALLLTHAYRQALPEAQFINFDESSQEAVIEAFAPLDALDLVILLQSTSFRLTSFRIRVELFRRGLKVIEHPHLNQIKPDEVAAYVDSLAYDPTYYRGIGNALKERIDRAKGARVDSGGALLVYDSPLESAKLNTGDYSTLRNIGGQFPLGEVFTEAQDLERVKGRLRIFAFGDRTFTVNVPDRPITLEIDRGRVVDVIDSTTEFDHVIAEIRAVEEVWVRELGFGLNRAFTRERRVSDIGAYERVCGVHVSLGAKHGVYNKPHLPRKDGKFHVDVFAVTEKVYLDDDVVFQNGQWCP